MLILWSYSQILLSWWSENHHVSKFSIVDDQKIDPHVNKFSKVDDPKIDQKVIMFTNSSKLICPSPLVSTSSIMAATFGRMILSSKKQNEILKFFKAFYETLPGRQSFSLPNLSSPKKVRNVVYKLKNFLRKANY